MKKSIGFSDVDRSTRAEELVDYLAVLADRLADARRAGYEMLRLTSGASVLDVGCGGGEVCVELAVRVGPKGRVAGIDPSEVMIAAAERAAQASALPIDVRVSPAFTRCRFPTTPSTRCARNAFSSISKIPKQDCAKCCAWHAPAGA